MNQVRQAQRTLRTLTTLTEAHPPARANLAKLRYSNLEVLARMAVIAPDRALEILDTDRRLTNRELLDAYQALKSKRPEALSPLALGQRASRALVGQAERIARELPETFGLDLESRLASWPGIFAWVHPRFVSFAPSTGKLHAFTVFHTSEPDVTDALARFFVRAATECTFFDVYHVFVRSPLRTGLDWRELGLENLGFYGLSESSDEVQVYQKPAGDPAPDRRRALLLHPAVNAFLTANL